MKAKIAIIGKGNIGWAIKQLLKDNYEIKHGDITEGLDARDIDQVRGFLDGMDAVISAGPFAINKNIGTVAAEMGIGYFDLTEDVETTEFINLYLICELFIQSLDFFFVIFSIKIMIFLTKSIGNSNN